MECVTAWELLLAATPLGGTAVEVHEVMASPFGGCPLQSLASEGKSHTDQSISREELFDGVLPDLGGGASTFENRRYFVADTCLPLSNQTACPVHELQVVRQGETGE